MSDAPAPRKAATWHDIALQFDAGAVSVPSPPMSLKDARALRFDFYRWRRRVRAEAPGVYKQLHRVMVFVEEHDADVCYVILQLPEVTRRSETIAQMLAPVGGGEGSAE